jgi:hypothetical protein
LKPYRSKFLRSKTEGFVSLVLLRNKIKHKTKQQEEKSTAKQSGARQSKEK